MNAERILLVAAHPDDETIGAGAQLAHWHRHVTILHATNGSPGNDRAYARARRLELLKAVRLAGIEPEQCREIGFVDQQCAFNLVELTRKVGEWVGRLRPEIVLTHPYESGHPDHDSCAFAVNAAVRLSRFGEAWEFTSYHAGPGGSMETGAFLGDARAAEVHHLSTDQQHMKQRMFAAFATQQQILAAFRVDAEMFRRSPAYDFSAPPHAGRLFYEQFDWGVKGAEWRGLASEAIEHLGLGSHATHRS
jgi:LmbE family N-acetylglucosaminyl deacetylase